MATVRWQTKWGYGLALVAIVGVAIRVVFVAGWSQPLPRFGDDAAFEQYAANLLDGDGYSENGYLGRPYPTAGHPPAFPIVLAGLSLVGLDTPDAHRYGLAFLAAIGIVLVGLVGRRLAGNTVGLLAATLAAAHPLWIQPGGRGMSESLYLVVIPAVLWIALVAIDQPTWGRFFVCGVAIGVATLTRSEALMLAAFVGLPAVWLARRGRLVVALALGVACVVAPWVIRNAVRLDQPALSTNSGVTLNGSYCNETFHGEFYGGWNYLCVIEGVDQVGLDDTALTRRAADYARDNLHELPRVAAARVGRLWGVYRPGDQLAFDVVEGRNRGWQTVGQYLHWILLPFVAFGAVQLARTRREWWIILAPLLAVTVNAMAFYGSTRMRVAAEPSLALLAALGASALFSMASRAQSRASVCSCSTGPAFVNTRSNG